MSRLNQIDLVSGILRLIDKMGVESAAPRVINTIVKAADCIIAECRREPVMATDGMGLSAWLASDDTGMSSKFMAHIIAGGPACDEAYPIDPSDFGRCYRFLGAVPSARKKLAKMTKHGSVWSAYIEHWDEMERLWKEESPSGKAPKLYALMKRLAGAARGAKEEGSGA